LPKNWPLPALREAGRPCVFFLIVLLRFLFSSIPVVDRFESFAVPDGSAPFHGLSFREALSAPSMFTGFLSSPVISSNTKGGLGTTRSVSDLSYGSPGRVPPPNISEFSKKRSPFFSSTFFFRACVVAAPFSVVCFPGQICDVSSLWRHRDLNVFADLIFAWNSCRRFFLSLPL